MFQRIFSSLREHASNDSTSSTFDTMETRRRDPRRETDHCIVEIGGRMFPVQNWSYGGALLSADDRLFNEDEALDFTIKFRLSDSVMSMDHNGYVLRKQPGKVVLKFQPLTQTITRAFQQVVDDAAAAEFANSQVG